MKPIVPFITFILFSLLFLFLALNEEKTKICENNFPLSFGSRGEEVKALQRYLLKIKSSVLPKYGADGIWGKETEAAVKLVGLKNKIDYDYFQELVKI